jgi:hypothetical protein
MYISFYFLHYLQVGAKPGVEYYEVLIILGLRR